VTWGPFASWPSPIPRGPGRVTSRHLGASGLSATRNNSDREGESAAASFCAVVSIGFRRVLVHTLTRPSANRMHSAGFRTGSTSTYDGGRQCGGLAREKRHCQLAEEEREMGKRAYVVVPGLDRRERINARTKRCAAPGRKVQKAGEGGGRAFGRDKSGRKLAEPRGRVRTFENPVEARNRPPAAAGKLGRRSPPVPSRPL
jgi:hypothetical protein